MSYVIAVTLWAICAIVTGEEATAPAQAAPQQSPPANAVLSEKQIRDLCRQIGYGSPDKRDAAVRELTKLKVAAI